mmetsp:Transcript_25099/g.78730  ORF Transcript_25099/g.78730 Transcript_25099/m.78730 type:complete len:315 (-) Transcript_25099:261-1205(-)
MGRQHAFSRADIDRPPSSVAGRPDSDDYRPMARMKREGYVKLEAEDAPDWQLDFDKMVGAMDELHALGLPVAYAFVFDEFWTAFWRLHELLNELLGEGYLRLPDLWAWRVDHTTQEAGWSSHRDRRLAPNDTTSERAFGNFIFPDGAPMSATAWIPLTNATTLNGCMYILPADRDPLYGENLMLPTQVEDHMPNFWRDNLQNIRALPVDRGGALVWNQNVFHWGSRASPQATQPRYSISTEFQSGKVPQMSVTKRVEAGLFTYGPTDPRGSLNFPQRLDILADLVKKYHHMHFLSAEGNPMLAQLMNYSMPPDS